MVVCSGVMACSQIAEPTMPKAKPAPPAAKPPKNAPSQSTASVWREGNAAMKSADIEHEHQPDRDRHGEAKRDRDPGRLAGGDELDRKHAQAER